MSSSVRLRLVVFALLGGLAVTVAGVRYAGVLDLVSPSTYPVSVELPRSGGIFERAEVTYRGVTVGRVGEVDFRRDGVVARLDIAQEWQIPSDLAANVHNRSAVGEQYVDLVPTRDGAPYLEAGDVIEAADTSTPVPTEQLLVSLDRFVDSVPKRALRTTVRELSTAVEGSGDDLRTVLANGRIILREAPPQPRPTPDGCCATPARCCRRRPTRPPRSARPSAASTTSPRWSPTRTPTSARSCATPSARPASCGHSPVTCSRCSRRCSDISPSSPASPPSGCGASRRVWWPSRTPWPPRSPRGAASGRTSPSRAPPTPRSASAATSRRARWRSPHNLSNVSMDDSIGCTQRGNTLPRGSNSVLDGDPEARHRR